VHEFDQGPLISCYLYNLCAGQYDMIEDSDPNAKIPMKIFVRNSKKDNIDH